MRSTLYHVLGVDQAADSREIRSAYLKKCMRMHPDKNSDSELRESFLLVQKAWEVLSDPLERTKYDMRKKRN
jgi:DnaJ-class molecular chaperone